MLDRSHEFSIRVTLSSSPFMSMSFMAGAGAMANQSQFLALGDSSGKGWGWGWGRTAGPKSCRWECGLTVTVHLVWRFGGFWHWKTRILDPPFIHLPSPVLP